MDVESDLNASNQSDIQTSPIGLHNLGILIAVASLPALATLAISLIEPCLLQRRHKVTLSTPLHRDNDRNKINNSNHIDRSQSTPRYGLALGEIASDEEDEEDDITARELRRLQQSPAYHAWCRSHNLHPLDIENISRIVRVYKKLEALSLDSIYALCDPVTLQFYETIERPSRLILLGEYLLSNLVNVTLLGVFGWFVLHYGTARISPSWVVVYGVAVMAVSSTCWSNSRPTAGPLFQGWYEDTNWGHRASFFRVMLAMVSDLCYVLCTCGIGLLVSMGTRLRSGQSVGERFANIRFVIERRKERNKN